jgi:hypothetical protein
LPRPPRREPQRLSDHSPAAQAHGKRDNADRSPPTGRPHNRERKQDAADDHGNDARDAFDDFSLQTCPPGCETPAGPITTPVELDTTQWPRRAATYRDSELNTSGPAPPPDCRARPCRGPGDGLSRPAGSARRWCPTREGKLSGWCRHDGLALRTRLLDQRPVVPQTRGAHAGSSACTAFLADWSWAIPPRSAASDVPPGRSVS